MLSLCCVHKSWSQCSKCRAGQGRAGSIRKEERSRWYKEGTYVRMDGCTQVCMYHVTYCKVRWSLRLQVSLISMLYRGEQEREPCLCLLACSYSCYSLLPAPRSLLLAQYRYRYGPWYRYWGRVRGTWVPGHKPGWGPEMV